MQFKVGLIILSALFQFACTSAERLDLSVHTDKPLGLQPGNPVVMGQDTVGTVTRVTPDASGYLASIEIRPEFRDQVRTDSRFAITRNPPGSAGPQIEIRGGGTDAAPMQNGAIVSGLDETAQLPDLSEVFRGLSQGMAMMSGMLERIRPGLEIGTTSAEASKAINQFNTGLDQLQEKLTRLQTAMASKQNTEEVRQLREQWSRLQQDLLGASAMMQDTMKKDVIPRFQKEVMPRLQSEITSLAREVGKLEAETRPEATPGRKN